LRQPPVGGHLQGADQLGEPSFGAGQLLVAWREYLAGDEHVPQVVSGSPMLMMVQCLVGGGEPAGGYLGQDGGSCALAQPVERRPRRAGCADRIEHGGQAGWDVSGSAGEELDGSAAQAAPVTSALLVELVFCAALAAGVDERHCGTAAQPAQVVAPGPGGATSRRWSPQTWHRPRWRSAVM
jgi:hypothetical protein